MSHKPDTFGHADILQDYFIRFKPDFFTWSRISKLISLSHDDSFHREGYCHFQCIPFFLADVEDVSIIDAEESVARLQLEVDIFCDKESVARAADAGLVDAIVSHV